jgi:tetratricopeptide (TPR) repeat protein
MISTILTPLLALSLVDVSMQGDGAGIHASAEQDALIRTCIDHIDHERYSAAFACSEALRQRFPESPAGPFISAVAYETRMSDYRVRRYEPEFEKAIQEAIVKAQAAVARDPEAENLFLLGATESYRCFYLFRQGRWLSAVRAAFRSMHQLERAHELDQNFVDPLLGLALYDHAKAKVRLLGIGLFHNHEDRVVDWLNKVSAQGRFVSLDAVFSLQYVYVDRGEFAAALSVSDKLIADLPRDPVCLYNRAFILERLGRQSEAKPYWQQLIDLVAASEEPSQGLLAECHHYLARTAHAEGDTEAAVRLITRAKAHADSRSAARELDGPYTSFDETRRAIVETMRAWHLSLSSASQPAATAARR